MLKSFADSTSNFESVYILVYIQVFPVLFSHSLNPHQRHNHYADFYHCRLVLPMLEFHISKIINMPISCLVSLNQYYVYVGCSLFNFLLYNIPLSECTTMYPVIDGHLGCFQFCYRFFGEHLCISIGKICMRVRSG